MINLFILFLATICANRSILVHSFNSYDDIHLAFDGITKPDIYRKWIPPPIESTRDHNDGKLFASDIESFIIEKQFFIFKIDAEFSITKCMVMHFYLAMIM